jgi:uncharacterized Zn finger protein
MATFTKEELDYLKAHTASKATLAAPSKLVCPHCRTSGSVRTEVVKVKRGISGGKAVGAVFTGGLSLVATGLSRKEPATKAHCGNCGSVWTFS